MKQTHEIDAVLNYAEKMADDFRFTETQLSERRNFGRDLLNSLNSAMGMFSGRLPRSKMTIDEKIAYWKKLAEETGNETD